ncbi:MAG: helix-turn-helix domain-containing protein, partial [Bacteroidota bacterium]
SKLAASINQPTYVVSHVVNVVFMKRFPEFINSYRVEEIKEILRSGFNSSYTIEGLAYDAGFNTLSAFYSSFKKHTGLTPKKFVERNLE